jgi:hypothetical protein
LERALDSDRVRESLEDARSRLEADRRALAGEVDESEAHVRVFDAFEEALDAAGCARALDEGDDVQRYLACAASAAARLFALRGARIAEVGDLDTGELDVFVDTSATNDWTLVRGAYAALASGEQRAREALGGLKRDKYHSDQAEVAAALESYAPALSAVLCGRSDAARAALGAAGLRPGGEDRFWISQAEALRAILDGDRVRLRDAMTEVRRAFEAEYQDERPESPERLLELPVLGLDALAREQLGPE